MRLFFSAAAAVLAAAVLLAACNSKETKTMGSNSSASRTPAQAEPDGVRRVTTVELRDALEKGTALVVDVRPATSYKQNHIKGSVNIPAEETANRIGELPRDKMIVTYCS